MPALCLRDQRYEILVHLVAELRADAAKHLVIVDLLIEQTPIVVAKLRLTGDLKCDDLVELRREIELNLVRSAASGFGETRDLVAHPRRVRANDDRQRRQGNQRRDDEDDRQHRRPRAIRIDTPDASTFLDSFLHHRLISGAAIYLPPPGRQ